MILPENEFSHLKGVNNQPYLDIRTSTHLTKRFLFSCSSLFFTQLRFYIHCRVLPLYQNESNCETIHMIHIVSIHRTPQKTQTSHTVGFEITATPGGGVLPYMSYIGMNGPKGYGFSAVLVLVDRVSILINFGHFGHKWGMVFAL